MYCSALRLFDLRSPRSPVQTLGDARDSLTAVLTTETNDEIRTTSVDGSLRTYDLRQGELRCDALDIPIAVSDRFLHTKKKNVHRR